eukprot:m.180955 g.180955  ORF g.180955 m.180955 type:complete len:85 (-) comp25436_c1_seq8:132-386(-)
MLSSILAACGFLAADDQSRNTTMHHLVAWNCGEPLRDQNNAGYGLVLKGNGHVLYANTFLDATSADMCIPDCAEVSFRWFAGNA